MTKLPTIKDFVHQTFEQFNTADLFYGHGTESAWDEAVYLVLGALHLPFSVDEKTLNRSLTPAEISHLENLIQRRIKEKIPVPYLINEAWFAGLPFYVDERVLIPRSPFAELIENEFAPWCQPEDIHSILDLCTGSGCIAIACAKYLPRTHVDATDISMEALEVAKMNVARHHVANQVILIQSDLFKSLPNKKYDLIISNPPYVDEVDFASLPTEFVHEPSLALQAGLDGLDFAKQILRAAPRYLNTNGYLMVEVGNSEHALQEKFPDIPFTWLEFERGGNGVFLLSAQQLVDAQDGLQMD